MTTQVYKNSLKQKLLINLLNILISHFLMHAPLSIQWLQCPLHRMIYRGRHRFLMQCWKMKVVAEFYQWLV